MQLTSALLLEVKKRGGGGKDDAVSIRKTDDHPYWQTGTSTIQGLFFFPVQSSTCCWQTALYLMLHYRLKRSKDQEAPITGN